MFSLTNFRPDLFKGITTDNEMLSFSLLRALAISTVLKLVQGLESTTGSRDRPYFLLQASHINLTYDYYQSCFSRILQVGTL